VAAQVNIAHRVASDAFRLPDGRMDFRALMSGFQQFFRENADVWRSRPMYGEAGPQLLLQAWLQRIVNGGGRIEREYAIGTGRSDLFVRHFYQRDGMRAEQRFVVEVKVVRQRRSIDTTVAEGLTQLSGYADRCEPEEAHLVVVDPCAHRSWSEKVYVKEQSFGGRSITVWGM